MLTREDLEYFYIEYKKNLDEEIALTESVFDVDSIEMITDAIQKKKNSMQELYRKNSDLLDKYLNPILNKEQKLNEELIETFLDQILTLCTERYIESIAAYEVLKVIEEYYNDCDEQDMNLDHLLKTYHLITVIGYDVLGGSNGYIVSKEYCQKILIYKDQYYNFESQDSRRVIILALFNVCINLLGMAGELINSDKDTIISYQRELMGAVNEAIEFCENEEIKKMDGEAFQLDARIEYIKYMIYGNALSELSRIEYLLPELVENVTEWLSQLYKIEIEKNPNIYEMDDSIFCNYWMCQYITHQVSVDEFIDNYVGYCQKILQSEKPDIDEGFYESVYFNVCNYRYPILLNFLKVNNIKIDKEDELSYTCVEKYLEMMEWLPHFRAATRVNNVIIQSASNVVHFLPRHIPKFNFMLKILLNRNEEGMLHAVIVRQTSYFLVKAMLEEKPELFVGTFDTDNIMDVLIKQEDIIDYVRKASLLFDIGKIICADTIQKESRALSENEMVRVHNHPMLGCKIVNNFSTEFDDIIMGHHKYYDGSAGYPEDYDNTISKYRFITDLITICDCMDSATDSIGRNYKQAITFEKFVDELVQGAGTRYNPDIVDFIVNNAKLQRDLKECCVTNRLRSYYETYYEFVQNNNGDVSSVNEEKTSLPLWTRNALRVMEIDFMKDTMKTIYRSSFSFTNTIKDTSFSNCSYNNYLSLVHPDDVFALSRLFDYGTLADKLSISNGTFEVEVRVKDEDEWKWLRFQFLVSEESFSIPQKIMIIIMDADEQCRRRHRIQEAIEQAKEESKAASRAKSMFISNISHEIRTPMNAIVGMVEILMKTNLNDEQKSQLCNIKDSGNALLTIINDILDYSKLESGKFEIVESEYSLVQMLNELSFSFLKKVGSKPVELIYHVDPAMPKTLYGDPLRIRQIIINLMNNAIKFTDYGYAVLRVFINDITDDEIELDINVMDSGIGIQKDDIDKLFERFQQIDTKTNYEKEGTGLGLVITKQLVELMGGHITVKSEYGKGSEFRFTLKQKIVDRTPAATIDYEKVPGNIVVGSLFTEPHLAHIIEVVTNDFNVNFVDLAKEKTHADIVFSDVDNAHLVKTISGENTRVCILQNPLLENTRLDDVMIINKPFYIDNFCRAINDDTLDYVELSSESVINFVAPNAKILIVDDTEMNLTVAKGLLQPLKMKIDTASSGFESIDMLQSKDYDIVFMDHKMPGMDGIETTMRIRELDEDYFKKVPIIALTASSVLETRKQFVDAGMNDFVSKPIDTKDITQKIRKWLPAELVERI